MQLHLHPTRHEALTASNTALTRWTLATNPATILAQMTTSPESVFSAFSYSPSIHLYASGGVTGSPDGVLFAQEELWDEMSKYSTPCVIEWRGFEDFALVRSRMFLGMHGAFGGLAASPNGRWLVLESGGQLFLLDWQTGDILSQHKMVCYSANRLAFDPTSTFVAIGGTGEGVLFELWRLDPAERFVPRPPREHWPPDQVLGNMALTLLPLEWERIGGDWPARTLPEAPGLVAFSPDSRVLLGSVHAPFDVGGYVLAAFEVASGALLWEVHQEGEMAGQPLFSPDGRMLLLPERSGDLVVFDSKEGAVLRRLPINLGEPVQALAFDHDGSTLWLATEERLVAYQPPS
jgi:WD40 repeat protein